jgi:signal transduction histidine kinase
VVRDDHLPDRGGDGRDLPLHPLGGPAAAHPDAAAAGLALWVLSGKIARRLARPLRELVEVSEQIGQGNLSARATRATRGIDEIADLGRSMNDMAARIQRQMQEQRELLAAVSHELRTPLARIRVLLDIARERGATAETLNEVERETQEIDELVGELLASARLEFQALNRKPLDAVEVAAGRWSAPTCPPRRCRRSSARSRSAAIPR